MADKKPYLLIKREKAEELEKHLDGLMADFDMLKEIEDAMYIFSLMGASKDVNIEYGTILENWGKKLKNNFTDFYLKYKSECKNIIKK